MDSRILLTIAIAIIVGCSETQFGTNGNNPNSSGFEMAPEEGSPGQSGTDTETEKQKENKHENKPENKHEKEQCRDNDHGHDNDNEDQCEEKKHNHGKHDQHGRKCKNKPHKNACKNVKVSDVIVNVDAVVLKGHGVLATSPADGMDAFSLKNGPLIVTPSADVAPHQIRLLLNGSGNYVIDNQGNHHAIKTPSAQQSGLKILMPHHILLQAEQSYKVLYKLNLEKQVVNGGKKCLLKPVLKGIGIEPIGGTSGGTDTGSDTGGTDGTDTGSTTGSDTGSTTGSTTGSDTGSTTGATTGSTTGSTTGTTGSTTGTTGGDVCQQCFQCITNGGTIEQCTPPCNLDCF